MTSIGENQRTMAGIIKPLVYIAIIAVFEEISCLENDKNSSSKKIGKSRLKLVSLFVFRCRCFCYSLQ